MATVHDVAAAVITHLGTMTAMKLQKLVYYCQSWHLARHGSALFNEPIEAWRQGPVTPALYRNHRRQYTLSGWPLGNPARLADPEQATVRWVTQQYGDFSAIELSRMTHSELPWRLARGALPETASSTARIAVDVMENYYSRQVADTETAVTQATASAALEGIEFDETWQNRLRDVAAGVVSADELIAEEVLRTRGV